MEDINSSILIPLEVPLPASYPQGFVSKHSTVLNASLVLLFWTIYQCWSRKGFSNPFTLLHRKFAAWKFLFQGTKIVQQAYNKSHGKPFEVFAPDNRYVFVTQLKHIDEIDRAPDNVLSMSAATKQMLQPKYTMHGFDWLDKRGSEGIGLIKAVRTLLTNKIPSILPDLRCGITENMKLLLEGGLTINGAHHAKVSPMITHLVVSTNAHAFFGKELSLNQHFLKHALGFVEETILTAEIIRLLPKVLQEPIGHLMSRRLKSPRIVFDILVPIAEQRVQERNLKRLGQTVPKHDDCIQWIMDTSPQKNPWTAERIIYELLAIWFGSVHAIAITATFAIHDLCAYPEYLDPLRQEVRGAQYAEFERTLQGLPLLDSFIKESARLSPVESMGTRRQALEPFVLSDGTKVAVGEWMCTPVRALATNADHFPQPENFSPFRFVDPGLLNGMEGSTPPTKPSNFTDINQADGTWHVWGSGRITCPGRFYASTVIKTMLAQIIDKYDIRFVDEKASRALSWRTTMIPKSNTLVAFTPL